MRDDALVSADGVTVRFGDVTALDEVSCAFGSHGVHGLIGVNGAGKTTLLHAILGLVPVTAGTIARPAEGIAYCTDTPSFEPFLTASEVMAQSAALGRGRSAVPSPREIGEHLDAVGLGDAANRRVAGFSRGMKQRLGIAAALVRSPAVLVLDEPTSALDPVGREAVVRIVREIGRERCVIMSSHTLGDVESVADRLVVLDHGSLVFGGTMDGFLASTAADQVIVVDAVTDPTGLCRVLAARGARPDVAPEEPFSVRLRERDLPALFEVLSGGAHGIRQISFGERSLQQAFVTRIKEVA
ncbi:ABC transporter ATP-binding protein [Xylanimonas allomyrinae]|uniref:ABC transporter ATP-binding protein n=1 Tax=Xylanimonas allomyrinae TaxID=2509459 RepID=A0A4P6EJA4_9MICO|nr:ABC transporter ATP-binding protein [Xylanimonas allomyrinae]QAY62564.1 ABC transporter ATP-binding protein [Xylanimonas allomyrinae]